MGTLRVNTITNVAGTGAPNIPDSIKVAGVALASANTMQYFSQALEPASPKNGAIWWNAATSKYSVYLNGKWVDVAYSDIPPDWFGDRGVFAGGYATQYRDTIDYIAIPTTGNATSFGTLYEARGYGAGCSNGSRAVFAGGYTGSPSYTCDYITIATLSNATYFGALTVNRYGIGGCSNGTRGVFAGGQSLGLSSAIDYITIATIGNAISFGSLTATRAWIAGCANSTRGVFVGGSDAFSNPTSAIEYVTIATTGNAASFGSTAYTTYQAAACSDSTRGVIASGDSFTGARIQYITIDTLSNATFAFDALSTNNRYTVGSCASSTRGIFAGGQGPSSVIDYLTIATGGSAVSFGQLTIARAGVSAAAGN